MEKEHISSLNLMGRVAETVAKAIAMRVGADNELLFFVGKANNGGDGLAAARILHNAGFNCKVVLLFDKDRLSEDCRANYDRLPAGIEILSGGDTIPMKDNTVIIDAIVGSGMKGDLEEPAKSTVRAINMTGCRIISIDLPSGMKPEFGNDPKHIVDANETFALQFPKLAMLLPEAGECCGKITILPIGLDKEFLASVRSDFIYTDRDMIASFIKGREKFSSKSDYGHALLVAGSRGMLGAAILATKAALRSGCGMVTTHVPYSEAYGIHMSAPSAMVSLDPGDFFSTVPANLEKYNVCGVGPGIGRDRATARALGMLMEEFGRPMVLDADALNLIADNPELRKKIPPQSILTPHEGEFRRLVGDWTDERNKIQLIKALSSELESIILLKGPHTMICLDDGRIVFNSTGTPGMAKGGSGDVLTGFITGLVARHHPTRQAAIMGAYVHGLAGMAATKHYGIESSNSEDIIDFISDNLEGVR